LPRSRRHCVRWGLTFPIERGHISLPIFGPCLLPNGCMDQVVNWYRGRPRPRLHLLDGDPAPPKKGTATPSLFGPCLLWPSSWIDQDPLGREVSLTPGDIVLDGDPASPRKGAQQPPTFRPTLLWHGRLAHLRNC